MTTVKNILALNIITGVLLYCENREWFPEMIGLGKNISRLLLKPEGAGHEFVRDLFMYWEEIEHMYVLLKQNDSSALEMYNEIEKIGGPPHIDQLINDTALLLAYNWTDKDIDEIHAAVHDTDIAWMNCRLVLKKEIPWRNADHWQEPPIADWQQTNNNK